MEDPTERKEMIVVAFTAVFLAGIIIGIFLGALLVSRLIDPGDIPPFVHR